MLHVGAQLPVNSDRGYAPDVDLAAVAGHAEDVGLESVWTGDHLAAGFPVLDSSLVLATAAAATRRIQVGYAVMLLALRQQNWAAKQIGTLQHLSGGRVVLGVGAGTAAMPEWQAAGIRPETRGRLTDQILEVLPGLLAGQPIPGIPVSLTPAVAMPDVWIGGGSDAALRRAVAYGTGWLAALKSPKQLAAGATRLAELAAESGVPVPRVGTLVFVRVNDRTDSVADYLGKAYGLDRGQAAEVAVSGSPSQVTERLGEFVEAGAGKLVLVPFGADTLQQYELFAQVRALLLAGFSARSA